MGVKKLTGAFAAATTGAVLAGGGAAALWFFGKTGLDRIPAATDSFDAAMHVAGIVAGAGLAVQAAQISARLMRYAYNQVRQP